MKRKTVHWKENVEKGILVRQQIFGIWEKKKKNWPLIKLSLVQIHRDIKEHQFYKVETKTKEHRNSQLKKKERHKHTNTETND